MMNFSNLTIENPTGEERIVQALCSFLANEGYRIRREVPNMGQSIDIAATRNRWITAIEAKMSNWKRALKQCEAHELVADFICIAIATKTISPTFMDEAISRGYGIMHVDYCSGFCSWKTRPKKNPRVWKAQRKRLANNLKGISYE